MGSFWSRLQLTSFPSFAFSRPAATTHPTSFDTADISVRGIALELSYDPDLVITARYRMRANRSGDRRPVSINFSWCPLWPISVEGSVAETVRYDDQRDIVLDETRLHLRQNFESWDDSEITIGLRWSESSAHPPLIDQSYLYLPSDLPDIGRPYRPRTSASARPSLHLSPRFDHLLVGAVGSEIGGEIREGSPLLQAVLG